MDMTEERQRGLWAGILLATAGMSAGQEICPGLEGNPELLTPGTATCVDDGTGNAVITMSDASLIRWEQFNIKEGKTLNFDFLSSVSNKTVVNFTTGSGSNSIDGTLLSNGRVVLVTPGQRLSVGGMIQAESFVGSTIEADDYNQLLVGGTATFSGGGARLQVKDGATIQATNGDVVLAGSQVNIQGAGVLMAPVGAVRAAAGSEFTLANSGMERIAVSGPPAGQVLNSGRVEAATVEMKAAQEISNAGLIQTNGGVGKVFLAVGPGGRVVNSGTGMINGILEVTGIYDNVGTVIDPDTGDAATTVKSAVSRFPASRRPGEKLGKETMVVDTGGVAASVDNSQARAKRKKQNVVANRTGLHRKSSFFGLRGGATRKKARSAGN